MTERNVCLLRILDGERSQHPEKINKKVLDRIKIKWYDIKVVAEQKSSEQQNKLKSSWQIKRTVIK